MKFENFFGGLLSVNVLLRASTCSYASFNVFSNHFSLLTELEEANSSSSLEG